MTYMGVVTMTALNVHHTVVHIECRHVVSALSVVYRGVV